MELTKRTTRQQGKGDDDDTVVEGTIGEVGGALRDHRSYHIRGREESN